ncbi:hypothetical protein D910_05063 [Dendroctonus ponderosae]|uniref:DUF4371 domain-containing protein n=1 Tax=Dendroctonus ponderosae TaxID=77166 RepID=U4U5Q3_DENPD|nr:hypothetical protein D910_05063 [Dendroctonus ponderosae]
MLEVCHEQIIDEINNSSFLAIMADETTDVAAKSQMAVILRYVRDGEPVERFWNYLVPERGDPDTLSNTILSVLDPLVQNSPNKLISQSYDGASVMSGQHAGVQALIKKQYPCAHYVHCYAHPLNLVISKAASTNRQQRNIDPTRVKDAIDNFESNIIQVQNNIDNIISEASNIISYEPPENKRHRPWISALEV